MKRILTVAFASCLIAQATARPCGRNAGPFAADTVAAFIADTVSADTLTADTVSADTVSADTPGAGQPEPLLIAGQMPSFGGGGQEAFIRWVGGEVEYPAVPFMEGVEGTVIFSFVVERDGSVTRVKELASPDPRLTAAVVAVVERSPRWEPGRNGGDTVAVLMNLPLKFAIPKTQHEDYTFPEDPEKMPTFGGGGQEAFIRWVGGEVAYPVEPLMEGVEGTVVFSFVVEKDGSVTRVKELASPDPRLTAEVVAVVERSPRWEPGRNGGDAVAVLMTMPLTFHIQEARGNDNITGEKKDDMPGEDKDDSRRKGPEVMPTFQGGDLNSFHRWVSSRVVYPNKANYSRVQGKVIVAFIVEKDGTVRDIKAGSPHPVLNAEAVRVIRSSPKWTPGTQGGEAVRVGFNIPLNFRLQM